MNWPADYLTTIRDARQLSAHSRLHILRERTMGNTIGRLLCWITKRHKWGKAYLLNKESVVRVKRCCRCELIRAVKTRKA